MNLQSTKHSRAAAATMNCVRDFIRACANGDESLAAAMLREAPDRRSELTLANAIDAPPALTPMANAPVLLIAAAKNHFRVVRLLTASGASINAIRRGVGGTALFAASAIGATDIVTHLLRHGARANRVRPAKVVSGEIVRNGASPLSIAALRGHVGAVTSLLRWGGVAIDTTHGIGATALFAASVAGRAECARVLLDAGASPHIAKLVNGATPCFAAASNGHDAVLALLIAAGADVHAARRPYGVTPLIVAAQNGHSACVTLLLSSGAHVDVDVAESQFGATALILACKNGHRSCIALLLRAGADASVKPLGKLSAAALLRRLHSTTLSDALAPTPQMIHPHSLEAANAPVVELRLDAEAHLRCGALEAVTGPLCLAKGAKVVVLGLEKRKELNGRTGHVLAPLIKGTDRYAVRLTSELGTHCKAMKVRAVNVRVLREDVDEEETAEPAAARGGGAAPPGEAGDAAIVADDAAAARADEEYGRGVEETLEDDVCERSGGAGGGAGVVQWTRQDVTCITFLRQTGEHLVEVHDARRTRLWVRLGVDAIMRDWSLLPTVSAAAELRNSNYYSSVPHTSFSCLPSCFCRYALQC